MLIIKTHHCQDILKRAHIGMVSTHVRTTHMILILEMVKMLVKIMIPKMAIMKEL